MQFHHPTRLGIVFTSILLAILAAITWMHGSALAGNLRQDNLPPAGAQDTSGLTVTATGALYFPMIWKQPPPYFPLQQTLFCDSLASPAYIPDNDAYGVSDIIHVSDLRVIADLDLSLKIDHTWVSDLVVTLTHLDSGRNLTLLDRPGIPTSDLGCREDNIRAIFDDEISYSVEDKCADYPAAISGIYIPQEYLDAFDGERITGDWQINVSDGSEFDTGSLRTWCLYASISEAPEPPQPPPDLGDIPTQANITGASGKPQKYNLDCEIRSAVDWADYFGIAIGEDQFLNNLPRSDNPDAGFVGNVDGYWGQIPPDDYGVHAEPVASLLRDYGLPAFARRPLRWDALRAEIAAGRPVIVWIIGDFNHSMQNGAPVVYTPQDGLHTVVAAYEHTVIVTGYTDGQVNFLNGAQTHSISVEEFLDSWSALGNMAITATAP